MVEAYNEALTSRIVETDRALIKLLEYLITKEKEDGGDRGC